MARWLISMPLGTPVEPEVYMRYASDSPSMAGGVHGAGAAPSSGASIRTAVQWAGTREASASIVTTRVTPAWSNIVATRSGGKSVGTGT